MTAPIPPVDTWGQFPLVGVIVLCFIVAALGVFYFTRWIWSEYKKIRAEDLAWRERQNAAREAAVAEQNRLWREAMTVRDARYEQYDRERQGTLAQLAESMAGIASQISEHDAQAKNILAITKEIDRNTRPNARRTKE
jgi:uncharacterized oligopeptide transporter (OPT) family protein